MHAANDAAGSGGNRADIKPCVVRLTRAPIAACDGGAVPVPGYVAHSTRRTCAGCCTASAWAVIPPIYQPSTPGRLSPSASIRAPVRSAMASMVNGPGSRWVRPIPAFRRSRPGSPSPARRRTEDPSPPSSRPADRTARGQRGRRRGQRHGRPPPARICLEPRSRLCSAARRQISRRIARSDQRSEPARGGR